MSDLSPRIEQAERLVAMIDSPAGGVKVEEVRLKNVSASAAIETVMKLAERTAAVRGRKLQGELVATADDELVLLIAPENEIAGWKELIERAEHRDTLETKTYTTRVFGVADVGKLVEQYLGVAGGVAGTDGKSAASGSGGFRMVVDELTGSLLVTASASQHRRIGELIERLDATQAGATPMRAFPIKNRPVQEIVGTLTQLLQAGAGDASTVAGPGSGGTETGSGSGSTGAGAE